MNLDGKITNPGELRTLISLQKPTVNKDAGGAPSASWAAQADVYCKWINAHGSEAGSSESLQAVGRATVLIRYYTGLDASWSILKGSDRYQVVAPPDDIRDRHEYMELQVQFVKGSV